MSRCELLSRRLAKHRRVSTGESLRSALPAVERGLKGLSRSERGLLAAALSYVDRSQSVHDTTSPLVAEHVRQAVLPDAIDRPQQELEAGIVEAASRAINDLHDFPPVSVCRPARCFHAVIPGDGYLTLILKPTALGPLLAELVPRDVDGEVHGVVGLRYRLYRRHLELYLVDHPATTRVVLTGLSSTEMKAGLAYLDAVVAVCPNYPRVDQRSPDRLSRSEQLDLTLYDRAYGPVQLTSGLLRRIAVLHTGLWVRTWTHGCSSLQVEWTGSLPTTTSTAAKFADPITGLPGAQLQVDPTSGEPRRVSQPQGPRCPRHLNFGPPELVFRPTDEPKTDADRLLQQLPPSPHPGWVAWQAVLTDGRR